MSEQRVIWCSVSACNHGGQPVAEGVALCGYHHRALWATGKIKPSPRPWLTGEITVAALQAFLRTASPPPR